MVFLLTNMTANNVAIATTNRIIHDGNSSEGEGVKVGVDDGLGDGEGVGVGVGLSEGVGV